MRTRLLILTVLSVAICSCQKASLKDHDLLVDENSLTKAPSAEDYSVSAKDMEAYSHYAKLAYGKETREIIPIPDGENPAFYIVNFDKGWKLISADRRTTAVLGESDEGSFSMDSENENMLAWVWTLAEEVLEIRKIEGIPSSCDDAALKEISANIDFWKAITADKEFISERMGKTKTEIDPDDFGYWEFVGVEIDSVFFDAPPRLMSTHWGQGSHYNEYCPPILAGDTLYAPPAGCVAVAGAQMAYFLHNKIGLPSTAPGSANINSYIIYNGIYYYLPPVYPISFGEESTEVWQYMLNNSQFNGYYSSALLISKIGQSVQMQYGLIGSGAVTRDLTDYFNAKGILCSYDSFSETRVSSSLLSGFPVIIQAQPVSHPENTHCFVIDGYKRSYVTEIYTYIWHNEDGSPNDYEPDVVEYDMGLQITEYCMNWGWDGDFDNSYFVVSFPLWLVAGDNYNHNKYIIHNFSTLN